MINARVTFYRPGEHVGDNRRFLDMEGSVATPAPPSAAETQSDYTQHLAEVPELASYGPVLNWKRRSDGQ